MLPTEQEGNATELQGHCPPVYVTAWRGQVYVVSPSQEGFPEACSMHLRAVARHHTLHHLHERTCNSPPFAVGVPAVIAPEYLPVALVVFHAFVGNVC